MDRDYSALVPLAEVLSKQGIIPGIKVDTGAKELTGSPEEKMTEGLDGLRDRLKEYAAMGARFAKWRAVIRITDTLPSPMCVNVNAHALARYAALCQEQGIVPIVEPEVLMDGAHTIERCDEVTSSVLHTVFDAALRAVRQPGRHALETQHGDRRKSVPQAGFRAGGRNGHVALLAPPCAGGGSRIVFLSGGQPSVTATAHLDAINRLDGPKPWSISFSYGRALRTPGAGRGTPTPPSP